MLVGESLLDACARVGKTPPPAFAEGAQHAEARHAPRVLTQSPCRSDPVCVLRSMRQVGPGLVFSWVRHFLALSLFTMAHAVLQPLVRVLPLLRRSWRVRRLLDALRWGAGLDYRHASSAATASNTAAAPAAAAPAAAAT